MASNLSTVAYIYKRKYADGPVGDLAMRDHPTAKMMRKSGGMSGPAAGWFYAIRHGNPQGLSGDFAAAQAAASSSQGKQLAATRRKKYGIIFLDGEALVAARDDKGAFLDLVSQETEGIIEEHGDSLAFELHRDGTGVRGVRASAAGNIVTLTVGDDARNFKVGMTVTAAENADGTSPRTGSTTVAALDEDAGTVTLANAASIDSFGNGDFLFRSGDPGTIVDGFESHLPLTAPVFGGDSFRGIDRGTDPRRLAGVRVNDTATAIEENAGLVAVKISQVGKKANLLVLNPLRFWEVARRLNAKVTYDGGGVKAAYGFEGFDVHTSAGTLRAVADPDAPINRGRVLNLSTWYWKTLDPYVHIIRDDGGGPSLRVHDADSIETRTRSMGNICCSEPGSNGTFSI